MKSEPFGRAADYDTVENETFAPAGWNSSTTLFDEDPPESLERQIRRNPADLGCHVKRIQYYQTQNDGPGCFAALVDLCIALETRGLDLRKRMIEQSAFLLTKNLRNFLTNELNKGITATTPLPCVTASILTGSISGTTELLVTAPS